MFDLKLIMDFKKILTESHRCHQIYVTFLGSMIRLLCLSNLRNNQIDVKALNHGLQLIIYTNITFDPGARALPNKV
jgi:hypothetical protein